MNRLQPVIWAKGTLLTPQHLQAQVRFIEDTLRLHLDSLSFRPWGFRRLMIDQQLLTSGTFSVTTASGIFPDGLLFDIPDSDSAPAPKPLQAYFEPQQSSLDVYLAIPGYRQRGLNVSSRRNMGTRFVAEVTPMRDETSSQSEKQVQLARKNFSLLAEGENREGNSVLRIARVQRTPAKVYQLDPSFIPPLLDFSASDRLVTMARSLVELLAAKSTGLAVSLRQRNPLLAHFTSSEVPRFWLLYTVNSYFPLMRHLYESRRGHPEVLFSAMNSLAGALTTFSSEIHPRDLPLYDHDELSGCFADLEKKVRVLLEGAVPDNFIAIPLKPFSPFIYSASLAEDRYFKDTRVYLAVQAELEEAELIRKAPALIRVWAANEIDHRINNALPGIPLKYVENAPSAIPVKTGFQYFSLDQDAKAGWGNIVRSRTVAAHVPKDIPNPKLEIVIVLPDAE